MYEELIHGMPRVDGSVGEIIIIIIIINYVPTFGTLNIIEI